MRYVVISCPCAWCKAGLCNTGLLQTISLRRAKQAGEGTALLSPRARYRPSSTQILHHGLTHNSGN